VSYAGRLLSTEFTEFKCIVKISAFAPRQTNVALSLALFLPFVVFCLSEIKSSFVLSQVDMHCREVCTEMGTAGIPRNLRVSCGCGYECCGNTAGMDLTIAGFPRG